MILFVVNLFAQKNDISIDLEIVSINVKSLNLDSIGTEKSICQIAFEFIVYNNTKKSMLFGSNTKIYYQNKLNNSKYGTIGSFVMINNKDTITLYTDYGALVPRPYNLSFTCWGSIEDIACSETHSAFVQFIEKWNNIDGNISKIYNYLNNCHFAYIPIDSDYKHRITDFKDQSILNNIVYPRATIKIRKQFPFKIIISDFQNNYYVFPFESVND